MKNLGRTELFDHTVDKQLLANVSQKLAKEIGVVKPENIELQLFNLKKSQLIKRSPLLQTAISLYEKNGSTIRLFNTVGIDNNSASLTPAMPFLTTKTGIVFMNMNRTCTWSPDMKTIDNLAELSDLRAILEFGYVMSQLEFGNNVKNQLFNNNIFVEKLTSIYTYLFFNNISKCLGASQASAIDVNVANMKFAIAKFFLIYCLEKEDNEATNAIAYTVVKTPNTTYNSITLHEENTNMDYSTLSGFLERLAMVYFANNLSLAEFATKWMGLYGEATRLAIEFPPFLLYFLYATYYNARLGSNNARLVSRGYKEQINSDLTKLISIIYSVVR